MFKLYYNGSSVGYQKNKSKINTNIVSLRSKIFLLKMLFILFVIILNCHMESSYKGPVIEGEGNQDMSQLKIEDVLKEHTDELMSLPGVVGTGQGLCDGNPCIKIFVMELTPELEEKIPKSINGYKVVVEATGQFQAFPEK